MGRREESWLAWSRDDDGGGGGGDDDNVFVVPSPFALARARWGCNDIKWSGESGSTFGGYVPRTRAAAGKGREGGNYGGAGSSARVAHD